MMRSLAVWSLSLDAGGLVLVRGQGGMALTRAPGGHDAGPQGPAGLDRQAPSAYAAKEAVPGLPDLARAGRRRLRRRDRPFLRSSHWYTRH
jgi:hypothetical protein